MSNPVAIALALALAGCAQAVPLAEVPIDGGTPEQRATVAQELAAFERWAGEGRVALREIRFEASEDWAGVYQRTTRRIAVNPSYRGLLLRRIVRHELCHALDYQEDHLDRPIPAFDALFGAMAVGGAHDEGDGDRYRRSEILARTCELGPAAALLLQPCPGDPEGLAPVAQYVVDEVWTGDVDLVADAVPVGGGASTSAAFPPEEVLLVGSSDGTLAQMGLFGGDAIDVAWVDLATGDEVVVDEPRYDQTGRYDLAPEVPLPVGVWAVPPSGAMLPLHTIVQGDRALVVVRPSRSGIGETLGAMAARAIVLDGEQWRPVDACPGDVATVFSTPDQLWLGWSDSARVQWAAVTP